MILSFIYIYIYTFREVDIPAGSQICNTFIFLNLIYHFTYGILALFAYRKCLMTSKEFLDFESSLTFNSMIQDILMNLISLYSPGDITHISGTLMK